MEKRIEPELFKKIPDLIRWILVLPFAFIAMLVVSLINRGTMSSYFGINPKGFIVNLFVAYTSSLVFVLAGVIMAPKKQFLISLILATVLTIFVGFGIFASFFFEEYSFFEYLAYGLVTLAGAISVPYGIYNYIAEEKKTGRKRD